MKIIDVVQGSQEWHAVRSGIPTASEFDRIVTSKGEPSKQRQAYMYRLAGERVTGIPEIGYTNINMQRGQELESQARNAYEFHTDTAVDKVGLCLTEGKHVYGCSPDGLIGNEGGWETKCPKLETHVGYLLDNKLPTEYFQQVQGGLLVTGRDWWDFMSYYPGMKSLIVRVNRDNKFINILKSELERFCEELDNLTLKIR